MPQPTTAFWQRGEGKKGRKGNEDGKRGRKRGKERKLKSKKERGR